MLYLLGHSTGSRICSSLFAEIYVTVTCSITDLAILRISVEFGLTKVSSDRLSLSILRKADAPEIWSAVWCPVSSSILSRISILSEYGKLRSKCGTLHVFSKTILSRLNLMTDVSTAIHRN